MLAEHTPNVMDYGLWGLLAVIVIRELFKLVHSALEFRRNGWHRTGSGLEGASGPAHNPHGMNPSELRGHLVEMKDTLKEVRDGQVQGQAQVLAKLDAMTPRR